MKINRLIFILLPIIFYCCAVQGIPSGGEADNSSPQIVSVFPINNKMNLRNDEKIIITFNQMINSTSAKMAFNVFPETEIIVRVKSNKIEIQPQIQWPSNQFNIIGSRQISNYYGKNLSKVISLAYSTTDQFFLNEVSGNLFNYDSTRTYEIGLFKENELNKNLNIMYKTEQNSDGSFIFPNIENENYIAIALESRINDISKDIQKYRYCILEVNDINSFNKSKNNNLYIYDNAEILLLKSLEIINKYYGNIILSNGDRRPFISNNDYFSKILFNDRSFINLDYPENYDSIFVTLLIDNNIETYNASEYLKLQNDIVDSIRPALDYHKLVNDSLYLYFTEPIKINKEQNSIFYIDNNKNKTALNFEYINPMILGIYNFDDTTKIIKIKNNDITDMINNTLLDSVIVINTSSVAKEDSYIGGNIYGEIIYSGIKNVIVELYNETNQYKFFTEDDFFHFINIKPGHYNLWAYENINKKQPSYFNGSLKPLKNCAKFFIYKDDIEVRSKWDIEGIKIKID